MRLLDTARIQEAMSDSTIGRRIDYRLETGSTMDDARDLARQGTEEGVVVIAEQQGRGRDDSAARGCHLLGSTCI